MDVTMAYVANNGSILVSEYSKFEYSRLKFIIVVSEKKRINLKSSFLIVINLNRYCRIKIPLKRINVAKFLFILLYMAFLH